MTEIARKWNKYGPDPRLQCYCAIMHWKTGCCRLQTVLANSLARPRTMPQPLGLAAKLVDCGEFGTSHDECAFARPQSNQATSFDPLHRNSVNSWTCMYVHWQGSVHVHLTSIMSVVWFVQPSGRLHATMGEITPSIGANTIHSQQSSQVRRQVYDAPCSCQTDQQQARRAGHGWSPSHAFPSWQRSQWLMHHEQINNRFG